MADFANQPETRALQEIAHGQSLHDQLAAQLAAHPVSGTPRQMRAAFAALIGSGPKGVACRVGGVACVQHGAGAPVLWLHGGGYVFGSAATHARAADALARAAKCSVIVPEYRLAPEHPWPAPLEDACAVLDALPSPVPVVGDSAGGHLALTLARHRPASVAALALISPNTDRSGKSGTRKINDPHDLTNSDGADRRLARMAMPDLCPDGPDASPVLADLSALPRSYVTAAGNEVLFEDAVLLVSALMRAERPVVAEFAGPLWHLWPLWPGQLPQADQTLAQIARFIQPR